MIIAKNIISSWGLLTFAMMVGSFLATIPNHTTHPGILIGLKFLPVWVAVWIYYKLSELPPPPWLQRPRLVLIGFGLGVVIFPLPALIWSINIESLALFHLLGRFIQSGAEELIFRGILLHQLSQDNQKTAVYESAGAFLALHVFNVGFNLGAGISIFIFGVAMARITLNNKSIWFAIGFHTAWNYIFLAISTDLLVAGKLLAVYQILILLGVLWWLDWEKTKKQPKKQPL